MLWGGGRTLDRSQLCWKPQKCQAILTVKPYVMATQLKYQTWLDWNMSSLNSTAENQMKAKRNCICSSKTLAISIIFVIFLSKMCIPHSRCKGAQNNVMKQTIKQQINALLRSELTVRNCKRLLCRRQVLEQNLKAHSKCDQL